MKQFINFTLLASLIWFSSFSFSDDHIPTFGPMEAFSCNFSDNKDLGDLLRVTKEWNSYVDKTGLVYSAWVLTPYYFNNSEEYDMYWIGFSTSFEEMANDVMITNEGQKIQAKFDQVCPAEEHTLWGTEVVRAPKIAPGDGVLTISSCTLSEGATREAVLAADEKWNAFLDQAGTEGGLYRWYPGSGVSSAQFNADFLIASTTDSLNTWGKGADMNVNGGGNAVAASLYGDLMECVDQRVFLAKNVRLPSSN